VEDDNELIGEAVFPGLNDGEREFAAPETISALFSGHAV
jgi:hypothetical protein